MKCGVITSKSGNEWTVFWDEDDGAVYVKDFGFFATTLKAGTAETAKEAVAIAHTYLNY
jgi:hypothetical protein